MLSDGLTSLQAAGSAREEVEVLDVAQMLLASVKRPDPADEADRDEATQAEPAPGDATQTESTVSDPQDVGADAAAAKEPDPEVEAAQPGSASEPPRPSESKVEAGQDEDRQPEVSNETGTKPGSADEPEQDKLF
jgi:hypothetical protein